MVRQRLPIPVVTRHPVATGHIVASFLNRESPVAGAGAGGAHVLCDPLPRGVSGHRTAQLSGRHAR